MEATCANKNGFLELDYICVHAEHKRQDLASMLLKSGIDIADKLGLDILTVCAGHEALGLFQKHGFELLEEAAQNLNKWGLDDRRHTYVLVKHPSKN